MRKAALAVIACLTVVSSNLFASEVKLIEPKEAIKLIGNKDVVFVSGDSHDTYKNNHIVGSVEMYAHHLHHSDVMGNMHCEPLYRCVDDAQQYIRSKGIRNDQLIIAYDNYRGPNATGVHSFFESFGHEKVVVLNGGFDGIKALDPNQKIYDKLKAERRAIKKEAKKEKKAGNADKAKELKAKAKEVKKKMDAIKPKLLVQPGEEPKHKPSNYTIDPKKINKDYIADKHEVKKAVDDMMKNGKNSKYVVIDTRSMIEIIGERKMDNVGRAGHVPRATLLEWKHITDMEKKKSFRSKEEMQKVFDYYGIKKDQTIYAYCMVGAGRSSHIISALRNLGYKNVKVFTGSWDTWGNDLNLPMRR
ncbi:MAG: rhodanese-like domain-containing protein [Campylobacterota bacterium]|nr:rhodanese-like domain-containing protein [Campylobacterota bacterium]